MATSAYWHGLHPGYYLSMLTVVPNMAAEAAMIQAFHKDRSPWQQKAFRVFSWFWRMRSFDYMSMGFMLLSLEATLRYWSSIYFAGHVIIILCFLIGQLGQAVLKPAKKAAKVDHVQ
jgi:lysophospholipid acyltransferase 7